MLPQYVVFGRKVIQRFAEWSAFVIGITDGGIRLSLQSNGIVARIAQYSLSFFRSESALE